MAAPTWAGIDFGFSNTDANTFRSLVKVMPGPPMRALSAFAFPSVDGKAYQDMGLRGRRIKWHVTTIANDISYVMDLDAAILDAADAGTHAMVVDGITRPAVVLVSGPTWTSYREWRDKAGGVIVEFDLEFEDLAI